jgi:hypothetical protein
MNQAQQQAIDRVFEILSEHFEHVVIAVGTYDEDKQYTHGGLLQRGRGGGDRSLQTLRKEVDQGAPLGT